MSKPKSKCCNAKIDYEGGGYDGENFGRNFEEIKMKKPSKIVVDKQPRLNITLKQRKWIKEYIETGNATEAAMRVYDCKDRNSASVIGTENLRKLSISDLMEEMGLTDVALVNIGAEGMTQANKSLIDGRVVPDYNVRRGYWETMLKMKGKLREQGGINIQDARILVIPSELMEKNAITQNSSNSSEG